MYLDRQTEMRYRLERIEKEVASARTLAEVREAAGERPWRYGIGERLVRVGARVAGLRPASTWNHLLQHSCD